MRPGRPTVHDRRLAALRLRLERARPSTPAGNPAAERRLYLDVAGRAAPPASPSGALATRTRAVDDAVARALGRGTTQVVLVGAGYDGRALRFGGGAARWFEVDGGATLTDKRRRLRALGVPDAPSVDVAFDLAALTSDASPLGSALHGAGHDAARPTLFVCEEVGCTSTLEAMAELCRALRRRAAPASALLAGFEVAPEAAGATQALRAATRRLAHPAGGRLRQTYVPGDPEKLVVVTGWRVEQTESADPGRLANGATTVVLACTPGPG